jgi:hypothetical protein
MGKFPRKPLRFQFGLRTMLLVVMAVAVLCWVYLIGWPWWTVYYQKFRFELAVKRLQPGTSQNFEYQFAQFDGIPGPWHTGQRNQNQEGTLIVRVWPDATYCLYTVSDVQDILYGYSRRTLVHAELFRLPAGCLSKPDSYPNEPILRQLAFLQFLEGDRTGDPGFKYELIFSNPPQIRD